MENAALSFIRHLGGDFKKCLIVCGKGNNGGDGYAIARQLYASGKEVVVFSIDSKNMSKDCQINYNICKNLKISMYDDFALLDELLMNSDIVVDAIFGTGLTSEVRGIYYKVIEKQSQGRWGIKPIFDDLDFKPHKTTSLIFVDWRQLKEGPYELVQDEKIKTMLVLYG